MTPIKRTILFQNFIFITWFISRIMSSTNTTQKTLFFMDQSSKKRSNGRSHAKCENLTNCSTSENNILSSPNYLGNALKIGHIQKPRSFSPFCSSNIKRRLVFRISKGFPQVFFLFLSNFFPVHSLCMYFNIFGKLWLLKFQ